ncbi:MAG: substrate-binding domain-containing protein [Chitinophagaceae bacterium]|nr:substrate-binding domain-containing protein [Chitinophagaceae bacterium]MCW5904376.1 substrate-binding domain-containing protein [Chitinophagaceae bacterium]
MQQLIVIIFICITALTACNQSKEKTNINTLQSGTIYISVDESFKPVIEQQIKVFNSTYPDAHIIASYKSEVDCFRDLQKDSTRMIIVARGLKESEADYYKNQIDYIPRENIIAYDAVAIIVNINAKDSLFTKEQLKNILSGQTNIPVIMDGNNATSTVRFLQDSILLGQPFGKNVKATSGSKAVIDAIEKIPDAIGFVGLSWVGNSDEPSQMEQLKRIKIAMVECVKCDEKDVFAKPSQATIMYGQYSLARPLFYILKEYMEGLGTGFKNFMSNERGQLIFRRAFLAPAKMNFQKRSTIIQNKIKE